MGSSPDLSSCTSIYYPPLPWYSHYQTDMVPTTDNQCSILSQSDSPSHSHKVCQPYIWPDSSHLHCPTVLLSLHSYHGHTPTVLHTPGHGYNLLPPPHTGSCCPSDSSAHHHDRSAVECGQQTGRQGYPPSPHLGQGLLGMLARDRRSNYLTNIRYKHRPYLSNLTILEDTLILESITSTLRIFC